MPDDKAWVIIPARGGSKGIPAKNLQTIRGWSLIARVVKAAKGAARVARVFVSTDDAAIAAEAVKAGAEIIDRPAALSGDTASSEAALLHALDTLERSGPLPASFAFVQCTSPFLTSADIDGTIAALATGDSAFSAAPSHRFLWRDAGNATGVNHDKARRPRRQERAPEFVETGGVYAMRIAGFRAAKHRFFGKTVIHPVSTLSAFEIDEPADLDIARALAPLCDAAFPKPPVPSPLGAVLFDFDGVLTDDLVVTRDDGRESVSASRADGHGIAMLRKAGVPMAVVSREKNAVVARRCEKLGLRCLQGIDDKLATVRTLAAELGTTLANIVYVGNDLPDLPCIAAVGLGVAVADAHPAVRAAAGLVLQNKGGRGAVRELAELLLST